MIEIWNLLNYTTNIDNQIKESEKNGKEVSEELFTKKKTAENIIKLMRDKQEKSRSEKLEGVLANCEGNLAEKKQQKLNEIAQNVKISRSLNADLQAIREELYYSEPIKTQKEIDELEEEEKSMSEFADSISPDVYNKIYSLKKEYIDVKDKIDSLSTSLSVPPKGIIQRVSRFFNGKKMNRELEKYREREKEIIEKELVDIKENQLPTYHPTETQKMYNHVGKIEDPSRDNLGNSRYLAVFDSTLGYANRFFRGNTPEEGKNILRQAYSKEKIRLKEIQKEQTHSMGITRNIDYKARRQELITNENEISSKTEKLNEQCLSETGFTSYEKLDEELNMLNPEYILSSESRSKIIEEVDKSVVKTIEIEIQEHMKSKGENNNLSDLLQDEQENSER